MSKPDFNLKLGTLTNLVSTVLGFSCGKSEDVNALVSYFKNGLLEYVPGDTAITNIHIQCLKHIIAFYADLYLTKYAGYVFTIEIREYDDGTPTSCMLCGYERETDTYSRVELRRGNLHEALKSPNFDAAIESLVKQHKEQARGNTRS